MGLPKGSDMQESLVSVRVNGFGDSNTAFVLTGNWNLGFSLTTGFEPWVGPWPEENRAELGFAAGIGFVLA